MGVCFLGAGLLIIFLIKINFKKKLSNKRLLKPVTNFIEGMEKQLF